MTEADQKTIETFEAFCELFDDGVELHKQITEVDLPQLFKVRRYARKRLDETPLIHDDWVKYAFISGSIDVTLHQQSSPLEVENTTRAMIVGLLLGGVTVNAHSGQWEFAGGLLVLPMRARIAEMFGAYPDVSINKYVMPLDD